MITNMKTTSPLSGFLQEALIKKVNAEANTEFWAKLEIPQAPPFKKPPRIKLTAGMYNLIRQALP